MPLAEHCRRLMLVKITFFFEIAVNSRMLEEMYSATELGVCIIMNGESL